MWKLLRTIGFNEAHDHTVSCTSLDDTFWSMFNIILYIYNSNFICYVVKVSLQKIDLLWTCWFGMELLFCLRIIIIIIVLKQRLQEYVSKCNMTSVFKAAYDRVDNFVFSIFLKVRLEHDLLLWWNSQWHVPCCHARTAATENARSPIDECLVRGTINDAIDDECMRRSVYKSKARSSSTVRYCGPWPMYGSGNGRMLRIFRIMAKRLDTVLVICVHIMRFTSWGNVHI